MLLNALDNTSFYVGSYGRDARLRPSWLSKQVLNNCFWILSVHAYCASEEWLRFDLFDKLFTVHPALRLVDIEI